MTQGTDRQDDDRQADARALLRALGVSLPEDALPGLEANRRLLLDHWARLRAQAPD